MTKYKITMELKTSSIIKKKEKLVRKLIEKFGEGTKQEEDEED